MCYHSIYTIVLAGIMVFSSCTSVNETNDPVSNTSQYVDMVYPVLDTENSRWFYFSSACRPFGMVNLSPDTQLDGAWRSGYRYDIDTIKGFSHIHAWQMSGLSVMPVSSPDDTMLEINSSSDFFSKFSHEKEAIKPGYHSLTLEKGQIHVELTSTKRVGFHRYTFTEKRRAIVFNLGGPMGPSPMINGILEVADNRQIYGEVVSKPTFRRPKPVKIFFVAELNQDIQGVEQNENGLFQVNLEESDEPLLMKVAISYTSLVNAKFNLKYELPHWDFDKVQEESAREWNDYLGRIKVDGGTYEQQRRFYTDLWKALQGRRTISDANGYYPDNTGEQFRVGRIPLDDEGKPLFNHYNSDSFWGAQWTINTLWSLVYPEITEEFVNSLLQYYQDGGLVPRGPSGGNYTYVMTGASSTPFIVSAYQKGIRGFNINMAYEALKKNHMAGGILEKAGYEHSTRLGGGLIYYLEKGYVPYPIPEGNFGSHQDGPSLTMEYAYQDWTLAQLARELGKEDDYEYFLSRSQNYRNVFDETINWMRPKDASGKWKEPFDPFAIEEGFNESNGAQHTWFVPHDLDGLAELMGGEEKAVEKLNKQFEEAELLGFTSGTAHAKETHPEYSRIPINYGNQPSIQTAFVFAHLGRPDLTQYWSKKVVNSVYDGLQTDRGYNGDEDQGLMGSLAVLMKMGIFQMTGGTEKDPVYEISGPSFDKVSITLNRDYFPGESFEIIVDTPSDSTQIIDELELNGKKLDDFFIRHSDIVNGGQLKILMKP
ncbi:MAG: alpha-mannosidase [Flammeovirgaceae bacterium]|nr:alpha-mannosidase [Flammeovirgaceae bacterium]HCX24659.1 glycoside hydrolase family 92 protein [Cytophagales bacterium]